MKCRVKLVTGLLVTIVLTGLVCLWFAHAKMDGMQAVAIMAWAAPLVLISGVQLVFGLIDGHSVGLRRAILLAAYLPVPVALVGLAASAYFQWETLATVLIIVAFIAALCRLGQLARRFRLRAASAFGSLVLLLLNTALSIWVVQIGARSIRGEIWV